MSIEDELRSEVARRADRWSASGITIEVESSPKDRDKTATWVRLGGPVGAGQLTVWSSLEAEEEWNSNDGEVLEQTHHDALDVGALRTVLDRLSGFVVGK